MSGPRVSSLAALLLLATGCGGGAADREDAPQTAVSGAPTLRGMVGTEDSPNAFEISLVGEDGEPVTELEAGEYNIEVSDPTGIHNFHLSGGGGAVDEKTGASEKGETLWVVNLEPGNYRYLCDPHPSMNGQFTVT